MDTKDDGSVGEMAYYTSETCGYVDGSWISSGCTIDYAQSEVKYAVDAWAQAKFTDQLKIVDGYSARLITYNEYALNSDVQQVCTASCFDTYVAAYDWMYNSDYSYVTMTPKDGSSSRVWFVHKDGSLNNLEIYQDYAVRPVINVYKSAIQSS